MQKFERFITSHRMSAVKKLNFCLIAEIKLVKKISDLSILISNPLVWLYQVMVTPLNHESSWENEVSHLCITERNAHAEIRHLPFHAIHKAALIMCVRNLTAPVSKIT